MTNLEILPALPEQQTILANLLELYIHDFSEFRKMELGTDGRFGYPNLPLYWHESGRHPLLVRMDGGLIGFALVREGRKSPAVDRCGIWRSSLSCVATGVVELEPKSRTKFGGGFQGPGRFASCLRIVPLTGFGSAPLPGLKARSHIQGASKERANPGVSSHLPHSGLSTRSSHRLINDWFASHRKIYGPGDKALGMGFMMQ